MSNKTAPGTFEAWARMRMNRHGRLRALWGRACTMRVCLVHHDQFVRIHIFSMDGGAQYEVSIEMMDDIPPPHWRDELAMILRRMRAMLKQSRYAKTTLPCQQNKN